MRFRSQLYPGVVSLLLLAGSAEVPAQSSSSSATNKNPSSSHLQKAAPADSSLDAGVFANGVYRNKSLGLSYKVPDGWVVRTEEMNAREESDSKPTDQKPSPQRAQGNTENSGRVLLAAFSRPPEAKGEEVNSSLVIAAESVATYPGLKEAAQYFGPLTEVAKAQGFAVDEEPYEIAVGSRVLVRGDFHKDVGSRVMRQSTLVFLMHGYAVSITVIGGAEDDVEELIDALTFVGK